MNLVVDIGNTTVKTALFSQQKLVQVTRTKNITKEALANTLNNHPQVNKIIISSTRAATYLPLEELKDTPAKLLYLNHQTPLPIALDYETPDTLGRDRIAAAVGAHTTFPNSDVLIIDMGTAITIDYIESSGIYRGGNISPGISTRFRSLHEFTGALPLVKPSLSFPAKGKNTHQAILAGVMEGVALEISGYISKHMLVNKKAKVILTGGDAIFFDKYLKNDIFVDLNLNVIGLNRILEYNA